MLSRLMVTVTVGVEELPDPLDSHGDWSAALEPFPVPVPPPPGQTATLPTVSTTPPTLVTPSGSSTVTGLPGFNRYSWVTSRSTVTTGVVLVAVITVVPPLPPPPSDSPTEGVTVVTRIGPGSNTDLAQKDLAGDGQTKGGLPALYCGGGGRGVVVGLGQPGAVAQGDQIVRQLAHIGAVGHAHIERPVGGQGTVEQWHLDGVYGVDRLVLADDVAHLRQVRVGPGGAGLGLLQAGQVGLVGQDLVVVGLNLGRSLGVVAGRC